MHRAEFTGLPWPDWFEMDECDGKMGMIIEIGARPEVSVYPRKSDECIDVEVYL